LPRLDAAYNLARWLTRNEQDAQDSVQEALLRAFRFFPGFRGTNARAWLMKIVRNTRYSWLRANRGIKAVGVPSKSPAIARATKGPAFWKTH
jgi:RNA polymerase sigma-70 factor, ECF subfamily